MNWKTLIAATAILALLASGVVSPAPARADAGEIAAIAAGATAAYIGVVLLLTQVILRTDFANRPVPLDGGYGSAPPPAATGVHFQCPPDGERFALVCW